MNHVDTTSPITHISLCAGYGGIDLGLKRAIPNLRTIAFSEIEAFAVANLVSKMEAGLLDCAPVWTDLKTFPWDEFRGKVDILSGGFPCQPFSCAGKRNGDEDPRHLFPYILDGIGRCRPSIVFLENVEGILSAKLSGDNWRDPAGTPVLLHVLRELERVGYKATAGVFSASEVGAPHQRKRVFIMAHNTNKRIQGCGAGGVKESQSYAREALSLCSSNAGGDEISLAHTRSICAERANQDRANASGVCELSWRSEIRSEAIGCSNLWPSRPGQPQYKWEPPRVVGNASDSSRGQSIRTSEKKSEYCSNGENRRQHKSIRQTEPSVGGNPNGTSRGVGHAELSEPDHPAGGCKSESWDGKLGNPNSYGREKLHSKSGCRHEGERENGGECSLEWASSYSDLYISCDNRTDELRLLGNGVVPATAALAFRTLLKQLTNTQQCNQ